MKVSNQKDYNDSDDENEEEKSVTSERSDVDEIDENQEQEEEQEEEVDPDAASEDENDIDDEDNDLEDPEIEDEDEDDVVVGTTRNMKSKSHPLVFKTQTPCRSWMKNKKQIPTKRIYKPVAFLFLTKKTTMKMKTLKHIYKSLTRNSTPII